MQHIHNLKNHFLIAMPKLEGSVFARCVIYLCEYNADGAMGLILTRPLDVAFSDICEQLELPSLPSVNPLILEGGPVSLEHGFILHREQGSWKSSLAIAEDVYLTSSGDVLEAIAVGSGPRYYRIALGYAGWSAGQLDAELRDNTWLTLEATPELVFDTPAEQLYEAALATLGVSLELLMGESGRI